MNNIRNIVESKYPPQNPKDLWLKGGIIYQSSSKGWTPLTSDSVGFEGWKQIESVDDLPENPTDEEKATGYLLGTVVYLYVGEGGDTLDGKYQSVDMQGPQGATGPKGDQGNSGYSGAAGELEVVNNLTQGGEESALSAEMGKMIGETLELDSSSEVVTERIPYGQHTGYITSNGTSTAGNANNRYSDPIELKQGDVLTIVGITTTGTGRLASCDAQGGNVTRLLTGESPSSPSASDAYETTFTADRDMYVIVGWYWPLYQLVLTKTYNKTTATSKIDDVDAIADALDLETATETKTEDLTYTEKVGGFGGSAVGKQASYSSGYTQYKCTENFLLKQGDILQITAKNVATNVSLLVTLDGTQYRTVIMGSNSTQSETYTAPVDGYYAVTWFASQGVTLKVTTTRTTTESERIANIEESTTQIPALVESVADLEDAVFKNVSDDMTTDFVDGYYINHNGVPLGNSSFAYKEFAVKAGAVIQGQVYSHQNIANLAKKIDTGIYEELVAGMAQTFESFSYTAPENMTIAVTFTKSKDRSITINIDNVESNTINIDNILSGMDAINKRAKTPDYGMLFDKVAVIGDSLTVGTLDAVSGDDAHVAGGSFGCSWLTCLAKKWGSSIRMHYGVGGSTCYSWLGSNSYGLGLMLKDSVVYDAYFIAYGHNDTGKYTIGTTSDTPTEVIVDENNDVTVETPAANTTFLGNYKKIVNEIRTKAPNALIFMLCTDAKDSSSSANIGYMNQVIRQLAEWYYAQGDHRVFYVDYINSYVRKTGDHTGGHWSTFGYVNIALAINDALNAVIEQYMNTNALKAWGNYLESYRTTKNDQTRSGGYLPHL